jgi:hypothetical protein
MWYGRRELASAVAKTYLFICFFWRSLGADDTKQWTPPLTAIRATGCDSVELEGWAVDRGLSRTRRANALGSLELPRSALAPQCGLRTISKTQL